MSEKLEDDVARALAAEADTFRSPVESYVKDEAEERWKKENPGQRVPDKDWEHESWKILARVAIGEVARSLAT